MLRAWAPRKLRSGGIVCVAAVVLLGAFAFPASAAPGIQNPSGPAPVSLFFHLADFQDFPINSQEPAQDFVAPTGAGLTTSSSGCLPPTPAGTGQSFHTMYGFSSPGFVEYDFIENDRPRFHPERDLSYDLELLGDSIVVHWYVATQTGAPSAGGQDPDAAPAVVPQVVVRATMRTGENIDVGLGGYNDGTPIAQGESAPALLAGPATATLSPDVAWSEVDGENVYEIQVPLAISMKSVPKDAGFSLRVDTFVSMPGPCSDPASGYVMPNAVRLHSSPGFRPRMDLQLGAPLRIEYLHPQFVGDLLYLHTSANSPLGNYDVDANRTTVTVSGPSPAPSFYRGATAQRTHEHGFHTQPVDVTFVWPYARDQAAPGKYTVNLEIWNLQHTASATAEASFTLGDQLEVTRCGGLSEAEYQASGGACTTELQDALGNPVQPAAPAPAWPLIGALSALGLAVAVRRRRFA